MRYRIAAATILLAVGLTGCRSTTTQPHLLLIDCRTQKIYPITGEMIVGNDSLMPLVAAPAEPIPESISEGDVITKEP